MRRIHALALAPLFALAACTGPAATATSAAPAPATTTAAATTAPSTDSPANTGAVLKGDGYTLTLPEGWEDATAAFKKLQPQVDTGAKETADTKDKFNDNVNVIVQTTPQIPFDTLKSAIQTQLEGAGSTNIEFKDTVQLDGADALQVWSTTKGADDAHTIQFMAFNAGKLAVLTVSSNRDETKAANLAQQVISGWKWTAA